MSVESDSPSVSQSELVRLHTHIVDLEQRLAHAERELGQAQALFHDVFESPPLTMFLIDVGEDGIFRSARMNSTGEVYTGRPSSAWAGRMMDELFPPEYAHVLEERYRTTVSAGTPQIFEEELSFPSGAIWSRTVYAPVRDQTGRVHRILGLSFDITAQKRQELEAQEEQGRLIEHQTEMLAELSTPLLQLSDRVVIMPLVGSIDTRRAQQILETLLTGVADHGADFAILDITGVTIVDTQVASHLIQTAQAAKLLGAKVILTGIRPEMAQILVSLGINLDSVVTLNTLQMGVAYALHQ